MADVAATLLPAICGHVGVHALDAEPDDERSVPRATQSRIERFRRRAARLVVTGPGGSPTLGASEWTFTDLIRQRARVPPPDRSRARRSCEATDTTATAPIMIGFMAPRHLGILAEDRALFGDVGADDLHRGGTRRRTHPSITRPSTEREWMVNAIFTTAGRGWCGFGRGRTTAGLSRGCRCRRDLPLV